MPPEEADAATESPSVPTAAVVVAEPLAVVERLLDADDVPFEYGTSDDSFSDMSSVMTAVDSDMSSAMTAADSDVVELSTEVSGSLGAKRAPLSGPNGLASGNDSAVRDSRSGTLLDEDALEQRIRALCSAEQRRDDERTNAKRSALAEAANTAIKSIQPAAVLSLAATAAAERKVSFFYESPSALGVFELAVFAVYINQTLTDRPNTLATNSQAGAVDETAERGRIERECLPFILKLQKAFHVDTATVTAVAKPYRNGTPEHNAKLALALYRRHADQLDKRVYYSAAAFPSAEAYARWYAQENDDFNTQIVNLKQLIQSYRSRRSAPAPQAAPPPPKPKTSSSMFSCCGSGDLPPPSNNPPTKALVSAAEAEAQLDAQFVDHLSDERVLAAYDLLLRVLLQEDTSSSGIVHDIYETQTLQHYPLVSPSGVSQQLLDMFADLYRIGRVYRSLAFGKLIAVNVATQINYFSTAITAVGELYKLHDDKTALMTTNEQSQYVTLLRQIHEWPLACLRRYDVVFGRDVSALKEAVTLIKKSSAVLADVDSSVVMPTVADQFKSAVESAVIAHYNVLCTTTKPPADAVTTEFGQFGLIDDLAQTPLTESTQCLAVYGAVRERLAEDIEIDKALSDVAESKLSVVASDAYLKCLLRDTELLLRKLAAIDWKKVQSASNDKFGAALDDLFSNVSRILAEMTDFYHFVDRQIRALPPLKTSAMFEVFIDQWIIRLQRKFDEKYIQILIDGDTFTPLSATDKYSPSVVNLFALATQISERFRKFPFTVRHVDAFVSLISSAVTTYVKKLSEQINKVIAAEESRKAFFGYGNVKGSSEQQLTIPTSLYIKLNCIYAAKKRLLQFFDGIDIKLAYDFAAASQHLTPIAVPVVKKLTGPPNDPERANMTKADVEDEAEWADDESINVPTQVAHVPMAHTALQLITTTIAAVATRYASGLGFFVTNHLWLMTSKEPRDVEWSKEATLKEVANVINYLSMHYTELRKQLFAYVLCRFMLSELADCCLTMERMMVYPKKNDSKNRLSKVQIRRLILTKDILLDFFRNKFGFPSFFMSMLSNRELARLEYLFWLLTEPSSKLLAELESIDEQADAANENKSFEQRELYRQQERPYLSRNQILSVLKFRVEVENENSPAVIQTLKDNKVKTPTFLNKLFS